MVCLLFFLALFIGNVLYLCLFQNIFMICPACCFTSVFSDLVGYCGHLVFFVCDMFTVCNGLFAISLWIIGMLCLWFFVDIYCTIFQIRRVTAFSTRLHVCPAKTQISMRILAIWSESLQGTLWVAKATHHLQAESKPLVSRSGRTCNLVRNARTRFIQSL